MASTFTRACFVREAHVVRIDAAVCPDHVGIDGWLTVLRAYRGRPCKADMTVVWSTPQRSSALAVPANDEEDYAPAGVSLLLLDDERRVHVVYLADPSVTIETFTVAADEAA